MLQKAVDKLLKGPAPIVPSLRGRRSRFPAGLLVDPADDSAAALHDSLSTVSSQVQFSAMESRWGAFYVRTRPEGKGNSAPAVGQPAAPARQRKRAAPDSAVDDAVEPRSRRQRTGDGPRRSSTASRDGTQCLHAHTLDGFVFADDEWLPGGQEPEAVSESDGKASGSRGRAGHAVHSHSARDRDEDKDVEQFEAKGDASDFSSEPEPVVLPPETEFCQSCGRVVESSHEARQCTACHGLVHVACGGVGGSSRRGFRCSSCRRR